MTTQAFRVLATACFLLPAAALAQTSGTAHPELLNDNLAASPTSDDGSHYIKPSPATPAPAPALQTHVEIAAPADDHYIPHQTLTPTRPSNPNVITDDVNSGIVTEVSLSSNQLAAATLLRATLQQDISTQATLAGTRFTAALTADVGHDGHILLPAGTVVHGRITRVHSKRIGSNPAIHLQPDYVVLPNGATYRIHAEVIDLDHYRDSHVNREGSIVPTGHPGATAAALGLTTTSAVVAGAIIGGGVGAVVGLGVGAGVGAIWWLKHNREEALPQGTEIVFALDDSLFVGTPAH